MASLEEEIREIEAEIKNTPYNKSTSKHIGRLKAKVAKLREELEKRRASSSGGEGYAIGKTGDATVVLVGFPSVGKSTLLNELTDAESEVAEYEFTTLKVVPGMMEYQGARIQILDVPGLVSGAASGRGRGKEVLSVVRNADLILFLVDVFNPNQLDAVKKELYDSGVRLDQRPPDVVIKKKARGGVNVSSTVDLSLDEDTIRTVLEEYRIHSADVLIREDIDVDRLIDAIQGNRKYVPSLVAVNKVDLVDKNYLENLDIAEDCVLISADLGLNIDRLKQRIYESMDFIRIYLRPQGGKADMEEALVMKRGATVEDVCNRLHRDFKNRFRYAKVWGDSAKHRGQRVGLDHELLDEDILTIIMRK